jgi:uncharacterized protein (DUF983 family)
MYFAKCPNCGKGHTFYSFVFTIECECGSTLQPKVHGGMTNYPTSVLEVV